MKKRLIFVLSLAALLLYLVYSCMDERMFEPTNERNEQLIKDAMKMYYGLSSDEEIVGLRSSPEVGEIAVKPLWDHAVVYENKEYYATEILLTSEKNFYFATPEAATMSKDKDDKRYRMSKTNFVYLVNKATRGADMFLMTTVPDLSYTEATRFKPFDKITYLNRDPSFSGYIFYHNMEGEFVNGWRYTDGKVTHTIKAQKETSDFNVVRTDDTDSSAEDAADGKTETPEVTTRSSGCITWYFAIFVEQCTFWGSPNGEITGWECYYWIEDAYNYTECMYFDDGGGSVGNGGYPPGGGSPPPLTGVTLNGASSIDLMDSYNLQVSISPSNYNYSNVKFFIYSTTDSSELQSSTSLYCYLPARAAGYWTIKAFVDGNPSNEINVTVQYPDAQTIHSEVFGEMASAWATTKLIYEQSNGVRQEIGFWIYAVTTGSKLSFDCDSPTSTGSVSGCAGVNATLDMPPPSQSVTNPVNGGRYYVAFFHTHTPIKKCSIDDFRVVGPSPQDISVFASGSSRYVPAFLYDYTGYYNYSVNDYGIYGGHNLDAADQIYVFGAARRAL